jgi:hypothetical protein
VEALAKEQRNLEGGGSVLWGEEEGTHQWWGRRGPGLLVVEEGIQERQAEGGPQSNLL